MSDDKIVTFRGNPPPEPPEEMVLVCTRCDNTTFKLFAGGKIECAYCDVLVVSADPEDHKEWASRVGDVKEGDYIRESNPHDRKIEQKHMENAAYAREFVTRLVSRWGKSDELCMLVAYNRNGHGQHWFDVVTEEQREWVLEKLDGVKDFIEKFNLTAAVTQKNNSCGRDWRWA